MVFLWAHRRLLSAWNGKMFVPVKPKFKSHIPHRLHPPLPAIAGTVEKKSRAEGLPQSCKMREAAVSRSVFPILCFHFKMFFKWYPHVFCVFLKTPDSPGRWNYGFMLQSPVLILTFWEIMFFLRSFWHGGRLKILQYLWASATVVMEKKPVRGVNESENKFEMLCHCKCKPWVFLWDLYL